MATANVSRCILGVVPPPHFPLFGMTLIWMSFIVIRDSSSDDNLLAKDSKVVAGLSK